MSIKWYKSIKTTEVGMQQGLETGDKAPEFSLIGSDGMIHTLVDYKGYKGVCFCFFSLTCETSQRALEEINLLKNDFSKKSIAFIAIASKEQDDSFSGMLEKLNGLGCNFDLLLDATGDLSRKFGIETTPHFFIFNQSKHLIYSGRLKDDYFHPDGESNLNYVASALNQLVGALPIGVPETEAIGTSLKAFSGV